MTRKEILEVRKTLKPESCCIDKIKACYVTQDKDMKIITVDPISQLDDDSVEKYMDIFKKSIGGTLGKQLNCLEFPTEAEQDGRIQNILYELEKSGLNDDERLEEFFNKVVENYDTDSFYCILVMHANYDIMTKGSDDSDNGSDEVYSHIICAICPVNLSKATLAYNQSKNILEDSNRFWAIEPPKSAFLFPTLTDRSTDIHNILVFNKKVSELDEGIIVGLLECEIPTSADEQNNAFIQSTQAAFDESISYEQAVAIHDDLAKQLEEVTSDDDLIVTSNAIKTVLENNDAANLDAFDDKYKELIDGKDIYLTNIVNDKFVIKMEGMTITASDDRKESITVKEVDGKKCIVIQADNEIDVNGITAVL